MANFPEYGQAGNLAVFGGGDGHGSSNAGIPAVASLAGPRIRRLSYEITRYIELIFVMPHYGHGCGKFRVQFCPLPFRPI
jgi:hypothetical protein